jgi:outer membrane protein OmpA-like peptidoglycan-associated protein
MLKNKEEIILYGHTDSKGSDSYNLTLSQKRIDAVKTFLMQNAYPKELIKNEIAFGKTKLLLQNDEDIKEGEINRRVEIICVKSKDKKEIQIDTVTKKVTSIKEQIEDTKITKGSKLTLRNLQFIGGTHILLQTSLPQLNELLEALEKNKKLKISIEGHICCQPGDEDGLDNYNNTFDLSVQRAKAIYAYLIQNGIDKSRLYYKGFGHSVPIYPYPEKNNLEQMENRRVEIKILDK